jgi:hypothetical protein
LVSIGLEVPDFGTFKIFDRESQMTGLNPNKPDVFDRLSPQQVNSLPFLAAGELAKVTAAKVGVTPQTVSLWLNHDENFQHALRMFKREALDAACNELQVAAIEAVTVVRKLLQQSSNEQTRLKAAQLLLDRLGLVGRNSDNDSEEAAVIPARDCATYAPPRLVSPEVREAYRMARKMIGDLQCRMLEGRRDVPATPADDPRPDISPSVKVDEGNDPLQ